MARRGSKMGETPTTRTITVSYGRFGEVAVLVIDNDESSRQQVQSGSKVGRISNMGAGVAVAGHVCKKDGKKVLDPSVKCRTCGVIAVDAYNYGRVDVS